MTEQRLLCLAAAHQVAVSQATLATRAHKRGNIGALADTVCLALAHLEADDPQSAASGASVTLATLLNNLVRSLSYPVMRPFLRLLERGTYFAPSLSARLHVGSLVKPGTTGTVEA